MVRLAILGYLSTLFLCAYSISADKQIKLEDIEKDTLKAAQEAKYEKQYQQYQQYQQSAVQYEPQVYSQQPSGLTYQSPSPYSQYLVPQQYVQQPYYSGYNQIASNSLGAGYTSTAATVHPFQAYINPQYQASSGVPNSQHIAAPTQTQPIVMAISAPALAALQQQAYLAQVLPKMFAGIQYVPAAQSGQPPAVYYSPQPAPEQSPSAQTNPIVYASQQYIPPFQPISNGKSSSSYPQQYLSAAPQTFSSPYSPQSVYSSAFPSQSAYTSAQEYSNTETPTFVTVKAPQHLVASQGQHQQFLQAQPTTISPLQNKYLNSPQYLAQNYNTIQSSHLTPKSSFSSGIKSTVSPPLKIASNGGFLTSNPNPNVGLSYQPYRNLSG